MMIQFIRDNIDKRFIVEVICVTLLVLGFAWNRHDLFALQSANRVYIDQQSQIQGKLDTLSALLEAKHKSFR